MTPDKTLDRCEYEALLRHDFASFAQRCFRELNPQAAFAFGWHIEIIAAKLAAVRAGTIRRLVVNLPPRHLKSLLASIAFPAWYLGHAPAAHILCVSYAQDLADKLARDCRQILASEWYRRIFPTRLSPQRQAVPEFDTTAQGCRLATSVGGVLTGRGADLIVIDDPLKPEEALSKTQRQAANAWFDHTLYSRLNDKEKGAIVLIMQRLHEDDLVGHVAAQEPWDVVRFPAIAEEDEAYRVETALGSRRFTRRRGEALHPEREPPATLDKIRRTIGEYNFAGQYQQRPAPQGGGLVKAEWFKRYRPEEAQGFERIVQSWDSANKATELSDFSVCTSWGLKDGHFYLLHVLRRRLEYPELKRAVRAQYEHFRADVVLIEDKASGTQLIQDLIAEGLHAATRYQPQADKIMRLHAQTAIIENGFVHLPEAAPWLAEYLHELTTFPHGRHDDQVDSTAQFLDWFKQAGREPGIYAYYRMWAERLRAAAQ
ncbi:MAG TPA: phage terminase large subunit [Stellaceae bacterium]|nr:phage terminase large subunit [Stellaceae bacterium]